MKKELLINDPAVATAIAHEEQRQREGMELIASENYQSPAVLAAQSSVFANKYAEGYPGKRYYGGQEFTDEIGTLAIERAKTLFHADHANVQALSGAAANVCIYTSLLSIGDTILAMDLSHGGHLTHGSPVTFLTKMFRFVHYKTVANGEIDRKQLETLIATERPKLILAGFSAYPRTIDYARFAALGKSIDAIMVADMSHIGGFIAAWCLPNPLDAGFHVMMTTTHKSMRGPRGALILTKGTVSNPLKKPEDTIEHIPTRIDRGVFPGMQGWPHMNTIAAIAVALQEAATPAFRTYAEQTLRNAQIMAQSFLDYGYTLVTGGTDNHMVVVDFSGTTRNGADVQNLLEKIGISVSKSTIPDDPNPPFKPSGVRIGIQAMTTRGVLESDTQKIVEFIHRTLQDPSPENVKNIHDEVKAFCAKFSVPSLEG